MYEVIDDAHTPSLHVALYMQYQRTPRVTNEQRQKKVENFAVDWIFL